MLVMFKDQKDLLDHYLSYRNIDENNCFFQKLFQTKNKPLLKNCARCNEFLTTEKYKAIQDFLKLDISKYPALVIYSTGFQKHSNFGNFYNSVDDILKNVKYRFKSTNKEWFKCSFNIENTTIFICPDLQLLLNTRYWTAETYNSIYFNDFIFYALRQDILKRVIINTMSGSSWYFKRFVYLAVKILDGEVEISI